MANGIYNFNAGPAILPKPVLETAAASLREYPGAGMPVVEISHRGPDYKEINGAAQERFARLAGIEGTHKVLFLQGGASLQFHMIPLNLMPEGGTADYAVTGAWAKKARAEADRRGTGRVATSTEAEGFGRIPSAANLDLDPSASYFHYTSNNTIFGTQWSSPPETGSVPLVVDASSDVLSRAMDYPRHGVIYAGAQKNLGPAGVTVVAIRDDLLGRSAKDLPPVLSYAVQAEKGSLYNTPPDASGFYRGTAETESRSNMNVTFRLPSEDLEKKFIGEAATQGLVGLKGHRSVGGCRASLYNAFPLEGVKALAAFMKEFKRTSG